MDITTKQANAVLQSNYLHGGNIHYEASRLGVNANAILDASASIAPFSPPKQLRKCLIKALQNTDLTHYPDRHHLELKQSIGDWHKIDPSMILPGNGAAELITWAAHDAAKGGLSILPCPGFGDYQRALKCWDGFYKESFIPLNWCNRFPQAFPLKPDSNVIWITNPHNPTGQLWSRESLEELLSKQNLVICDEAFLPLVPQGESQSLIPLVSQYQNLIVIRSLTKLFAIAGLRFGYAISSAKRLNKWHSFRDPWPVNGLAIAGAKMLFGKNDILKKQTERIHKWIIKENHWMQTKMKELPGISVHPSSANFFLIESNVSLIHIKEKLRERLILIRDCNSFEGLNDRWLRISLQKRDGNRRILKAITSALNENE